VSATYTRLRDGSWGLRVQSSGKPSGNITVTTKAGKTKTETIDRVLWSGDCVHLCSVVESTECAECGKPGAKIKRHDMSGIAGLVCSKCARDGDLSFA